MGDQREYHVVARRYFGIWHARVMADGRYDFIGGRGSSWALSKFAAARRAIEKVEAQHGEPWGEVWTRGR